MRLSLRIVVVAVVLSTSAVAFAAEPTADEKNAARGMLVDGYVALDKGDAKHALDLFRKADAVMHVPTTKLAVARAQARLGQNAEAEESLHELLKTPERPDDPAPFAKARIDARNLLNEVSPKVAEITFRGIPDDATVKLDGVVVAKVELGSPRRVNAGRHVVEVAQLGNPPKEQAIELREGEKHTVGVDTGGAPPPPASGTNVLMIAGFATAGIGVVVGSITGFLAIGKKSDAEKLCVQGKCPPEANPDLDAAGTFATISTVSFIVGAVGLGVGIYGLLSPPKADAAATTGLRVRIGGPGLVGTF